MKRIKEYSAQLGEGIKGIEVKRVDDYKDLDYPQVNINGYRILPLICCEIYSLIYDFVKTPKNPADVITVSCFNLDYFNNGKEKVNDTKLKGVIEFLEDLGFLADEGKLIFSNPFWVKGEYIPTTVVADKEGFSVGEEVLYTEI